MNSMVFRSLLLLLCLSCLIVMLRAQGTEKPKKTSGEIDLSVIATLSRQGVKTTKVISHVDLTEPFETRSQWSFVTVGQDGPPAENIEDTGPISLCFVKGISANCDQPFYKQNRVDTPFFDTPYRLLAGAVVYARRDNLGPLFLLKVCGASSANGNCNLATALYRYDKEADRFTQVFTNRTGHNNNEDTRFVESGPLQGDVVVNYPTDNAPYTYWVEVFRAGDTGKYDKILRYRGRTQYGDGNPLAVIDSEMPEILHRMGLWNPGDPLPVPPQLSQGCKVLSMRRGEEWCK